MCGSSPLPDAVTRSTGTGAVLPGSAARIASTRPCTDFTSAGFVGLRFEPENDAAVEANGVVAAGRAQEYFGWSKVWPIRAPPTTLPFLAMRLPFASLGSSV